MSIVGYILIGSVILLIILLLLKGPEIKVYNVYTDDDDDDINDENKN